MQIQLCEDDGIFHEGIPQIVILVVKFDDGKVKRIPYPAEKTLSALYQDLNAIAPQVTNAPDPTFSSWNDLAPQQDQVSAPKASSVAIKPPSVEVDRSNIIEREDIVTVTRLNPRDTVYSGTVSPLMVGSDYRVMEVFGPHHPVTGKRIPQGYDVVDDTSPNGLERMRVYPDEVVLKSKRKSAIIPQVHVKEEILKCPVCQVPNSLGLVGDEYKGTCQSCNLDITIARIVKKCMTPKCGQEVSCFDVGGQYEGKCNKCGAAIEVPYA